MIRTLLKLAVFLIIGILIYNYFLGTPSEKETSKKVFGEVKNVAVGVGNLLKSEKKKFDAGKYDKALDKIGDMLDKLKRTAKEGEEHLDQIRELEQKREALEQELNDYEQETEDLSNRKDEFTPKGGAPDSTKIKRDMDKLLRETEQLIKDMEAK